MAQGRSDNPGDDTGYSREDEDPVDRAARAGTSIGFDSGSGVAGGTLAGSSGQAAIAGGGAGQTGATGQNTAPEDDAGSTGGAKSGA